MAINKLNLEDRLKFCKEMNLCFISLREIEKENLVNVNHSKLGLVPVNKLYSKGVEK